MMARARQLPGSTPAFDALLGIVASREDPIAQGRHKVWGSRPLWVPPQTSTIASHLPKAVGMAFSLARARRLGLADEMPPDAIVMTSFGDATVNHATALAAFNTARYGARIGLPMPVLFVCEDNQTGISVPTPEGWIEATFANQPHLHYRRAGGDLDEIWDTVAEAIHLVRAARASRCSSTSTSSACGATPAPTRSRRTGPPTRSRPSSGRTRSSATRAGWWRPEPPARPAAGPGRGRPRARCGPPPRRRRTGRGSAPRRGHRPAGPLPPRPGGGSDREPVLGDEARATVFKGTLPETATQPTARTLAGHINAALTDELARRPELLVFGEDVARKGGVYNVTHDLQKRFGAGRVFDTLLDETSILGIAQGAAHAGLLPIPRSSTWPTSTTRWTRSGARRPRSSSSAAASSATRWSSGVPGLAYQKGFGGHFHNDNSVGALRDIPGVILAVPSRSEDAARMLRGCIGDGARGRAGRDLPRADRALPRARPPCRWRRRLAGRLPSAARRPPARRGGHPGDGTDLLIVSYANGLRLSAPGPGHPRADHGVAARVMDLRWLNPLPVEAVRSHAVECGRVLVVDECRATGGGVADALIAGPGGARLGRPARQRAGGGLIRAARDSHGRGPRRPGPGRGAAVETARQPARPAKVASKGPAATPNR